MAAATPAGRRDPVDETRPTEAEPAKALSPAAGTPPGGVAAAADMEPGGRIDGNDLTEVGGLLEAPTVASRRTSGRSQPAAAEQVSAPYGSRREARERALSLLYEADAKAITPAALLEEIPVEPPPYVTSLVSGVGESQERIDELIARYAIDWTIDRMPVVDRMVVRIATFELLGRPDVPTGVVISEAVELAKRYSTDESGRFVNGVLASIAAEIRPTA
jgi:N utilization substance protein B